MRNNDLTDFNMYEQSLTMNVKQPNGAYSEQATPPPNLITKDITDNGEYSAADDNADGYSSVTVDVSSSGGGFSILSSVWQGQGTNTNVNPLRIYRSANGSYTLPTMSLSSGMGILFDAVVDFGETNWTNIEGIDFLFTPSETFNDSTVWGSYTKTGTTVTPGDGKTYTIALKRSGYGGAPTINVSKSNTPFVATVE